MRNKDVNRQVLKAISIGLTAALSLMPTVSAFADDDVDSGESHEQHHEESHSESSSESSANDSVQESVSDASGAVETAESYCESPSETPAASVAEEAAGDVYLFSSTVYDSLEASQDAVDSIGQDITALDQLNLVTENANEAVEAALGVDDEGNIIYNVVSTPIGSAENKVETAASKVETASSSVKENDSKVRDSASSTAVAADAEYESDAAANVAKNQALQDLAGVDDMVAESQQAVIDAQTAVNAATDALGIAQEAVDTASKALADAQAAEKAAQDKLDQMKSEWDFEIVDGEIVFGENSPANENRARAAIESVSDALDKAKDETSQATDSLIEANLNAEEAARVLAEAAEEKSVAASAAYDTFVTGLGQERLNELADMLTEIQTQRGNILKKQDSNSIKDINEFRNINRNLAFSIVKYMLAQNPDIDSSTIETTLEKGNVKKVNGGFEVRYVDKDGVSHTEYYNYKAYRRDGNEVEKEVSTRGYSESDHIVVLKKAADGTESTFVSEAAINNGLDDYQSLASAKIAAEAELAEAKSAYNGYYNLNDAKALLAEAETGAEDLAFWLDAENKDRVDDVYKAIIGWRDTVQSDYEAGKGTNKYWDNNRELARHLVEYTLLRRMYNGEIKGFEFETDSKDKLKWVKNHGVESNYGTVIITTNDGDTIPLYFDYISYYEDGEVAPGDTGSANDFSRYGKKPDHIVVVTKGDSTKQFENGDLYFDKKGKDLISVADVLADRARIQKVENARITVSLAAVEEAKQKVTEAVKALDEIKVTGAETAKEFGKLQERLQKAQDDYDKAVEDLKTANDALEETVSVRNEMEKTIEEGFKKRTPKPASEPTSDNPGSDEESGSSGDDDTVDTPAVPSDGPVVDITTPTPAPSAPVEDIGGAADAGGAAAFADLGGGTSTVDAGAFGDISNIESGVLDEGGDLLEEGVLGERMAPIVDAVNNGTFKRSMLFAEDGLEVSFMWWLIMLAFGAKGVQMYVKSRRKEAKETEPEK